MNKQSQQGEDQGGEVVGPYKQAQIDAGIRYKGWALEQLVRELVKADGIKETLYEKHARCQGVCDLLRYTLIPQQMEKDKIDTIVYKGVGRVSVSPDLLVSVKGGMKEALFKWMRKNKLADLIQDTINSSTLRAWAKTRIKEGKKIPDELLNVTPVTRTSIAKV